MIPCALCDYEVLFSNYHVFEYSATNINRRDAEFAETWKFTLLPALETPMSPGRGSHVTDGKPDILIRPC